MKLLTTENVLFFLIVSFFIYQWGFSSFSIQGQTVERNQSNTMTSLTLKDEILYKISDTFQGGLLGAEEQTGITKVRNISQDLRSLPKDTNKFV